MNFYTDVALIGNKICLRGVENNRRFTRRVDFEPSIFLESDVKTPFVALYDRDLYLEEQRMSIKEYKQYIRDYKDLWDLHGQVKPEFQFISKKYGVNCDYDIEKIRILTIDIETAVGDGFPYPQQADQEVTLITLGIKGGDKYTFGCGDYTPSRSDVHYFKFQNEEKLLEAFLRYWTADYPDIITSWNGDGFDMPYMYNRIKRVFDEKTANTLSPWKRCWMREVDGKYGSTELRIKIYGIQQLDLLALYRKNILEPRESYKLDNIADVELGRGKIDYSEVGSLHKLYLTNFQKYTDYNIEDVQLVEDIDEKQKLIEFTVMMGFKFGVNFEDVASQVKCWDTLIYNDLMQDNIIVPPKKENIFVRKYAGAYVKEPLLGMHDWVVSYDLASLYPSIYIMQNASPETLVTKAHLMEIAND